jgi:hypothetical protein
MTLDNLILLLNKVKKTGASSYIACCPAHNDKSPSLTLKETSDGRILIHCFAGCSIGDITSALNIEISDLYSDKTSFSPYQKQVWNAQEVLHAISHELSVVGVVCSDIKKGKVPSDDDYARFLMAINRIQTAEWIACQHLYRYQG